MSPRTTAVGLVALLAAAGVTHLVRPAVFDAAVPRAIPGRARTWVLVSGLAEIALAGALAYPPTRPIGGIAAAAFFVAVFPGNVQMAADARSRRARIITLARLPLQFPLVAGALRARAA